MRARSIIRGVSSTVILYNCRQLYRTSELTAITSFWHAHILCMKLKSCEHRVKDRVKY